MVKSVQAFIEAKSVAAVAKATGRTEGAVMVWKTRQRFPREAWLELSLAYPELTLDVLKRLERKAPKRTRETDANPSAEAPPG